jgi:hypothetical protein
MRIQALSSPCSLWQRVTPSAYVVACSTFLSNRLVPALHEKTHVGVHLIIIISRQHARSLLTDITKRCISAPSSDRNRHPCQHHGGLRKLPSRRRTNHPIPLSLPGALNLLHADVEVQIPILLIEGYGRVVSSTHDVLRADW